MKVGCLGDIVFEVSEKNIKTITNAAYSGNATYQTHQRHLKTGLTEFTGIEPESFTFDVVLSSYLGVKPWTELQKIRKYMNAGTALPLVIGTMSIGKYRWTIVSFKAPFTAYGKRAALTSTTVSITLKEYLKS